MGFTFLSPIYLVGLLAAAIPLIIHLSRSRRTKKMRFSTTRFFTEQFLRSYRMSRLKELLLLLCRMALFAVLAMALARPLFLPRGAGATMTGSGQRAVFIVLDDSASMAYSEDGVTLFRRAQEAASTVVRSLSSGDEATVILAGRREAGPEVLFDDPIDDLDEVQKAIDRVKVGTLGTDLSGAIARAKLMGAAARANGRSVQIYVLSDMQESGWDLAPDTVAADKDEIAYTLVAIRPRKDVSNRAVAAVRYAATRPRVNVPFAIRPLVSMVGDRQEAGTVRLVIDGAKVGEQKVERLARGQWASPQFHHTFQSPGWHGGHVEIDDPSLAGDNRRFFALEVPRTTRTVNILAVNGAPSSIAHQDELFFLRLALTAAPEGQSPPFQMRAVAPSEVATVDLEKYPLVILANVERLSEAAVEKLEDYVSKGGKLLVFLGDRVDHRFYNDKLAGENRRHGGLLPGTIKPRARVVAVGYIGEMMYDHRALAAFSDPRIGTLLGSSLTFRALPLEVIPQRVLMKSSSGTPLLCEKTFGQGNVMLFASTCDKDWSDFPIRPGFPLWARFIAEYLTQKPLNLQSGYRTGDIVRLPAPADEKSGLWIRKPAGQEVRMGIAGDGLYEFSDTVEPGVYTVLRSDKRTRVGLFAVNLESYESDLSYIEDADELKERLGNPALFTLVDDPAKLSEELGRSRRGFRLWDLFLFLVLVIALFEPWLANQISARLFAQQASVLKITPSGSTARPTEPARQEVAS